eukprot:1343819-Amphidinium_carterae.1
MCIRDRGSSIYGAEIPLTKSVYGFHRIELICIHNLGCKSQVGAYVTLCGSRHVSNELRNDKEVVMAAVAESGASRLVAMRQTSQDVLGCEALPWSTRRHLCVEMRMW